MGELMLGSGASVSGHVGAMLAYMNPGTGSLLLQMLLVGMASGYLYLKSARHNLRAFFSRRKADPPPAEPEQAREPGDVKEPASMTSN